MRTDTAPIHKLVDYRPTDYLIREVGLVFRLTPENTVVKARLAVERREGSESSRPLDLDGDGLKLRSIHLDNRPMKKADHSVSPEKLSIFKPPAEPFVLDIETELSPQANAALMGLYRSNGTYCTQCEAEGFRRITYFLDRPDVLSVYTVRIEARKTEAPVLLSNGNPGKTGELADGWHYAEWHDPYPKPSYLFALVAGDLARVGDRFTTTSGRQVDLAIYVEHGNQARAAYAMDALKRSMRWDEERFGREYDLDVFNIVAVPDFNMGAMENKGLNIFNDKYVLADAETATDTDFANIEGIIAHEYFHNWTGNRITCRDWFQLCLKEGLTVFRDHEFSADQRSAAVKRISVVRTLKSHQFPEDAGPLAHPVRPQLYREINNFYTATVYEKGAEVIRMLRTIIGGENFRRGMDLYFERFDGTAATVEDFIGCFEEAAGADLSQFMHWYEQAGTPHVAISRHYDQAKRILTLEMVQSVPATPGQARKKLMHIPIAFGLIDGEGKPARCSEVSGAEIDGEIINLRRRHHKITFTDVEDDVRVSLLRGFSAPVILDYEQAETEKIFLARHDDDPVARWQAFTQYQMAALVKGAERARAGDAPVFESRLVDTIVEIATDGNLEPAYRGLMLSLPSEADIAREIAHNICPDAIHDARDALAAAIARRGREAFEEVQASLTSEGPFSADAGSAGRRALRNELLGFLCLADGGPQRALTAYHEADNMTVRAAAFSFIVTQFPDSKAAAEVLTEFERRFANNNIVMDKWFTVQACIPGAEAVERVKKLTAHRAFSERNPNRFRALIGAFANGNQTGFNRSDGAGYEFVADRLLAVDVFNPQIAARIATAFRSYKSLEPTRRQNAKATLKRIAGKRNLSTDLRDIVDRLLG